MTALRNTWSTRVVSLALVALGLPLGGCPSQQIVSPKQIEVAEVDDQQATCKVAADPNNPLIVEWPGTSRTELETASQRGLVVVSYASCRLKILASCSVDGKYDLTRVTPSRDRLTISNENDLYAKLPLGAASLSSELKQGASLELDYVSVGQRIASPLPPSRSGDCGGATHYVRSITVGAFSLDAATKGSASAGVDVAGIAGGGGERRENMRKIRGSGDVERCANDPEAECNAVLQLGLAPLASTQSGQILKTGDFGGVGVSANIPMVQQFDSSNIVVPAGLQAADTRLLDLFQTAKRTEKDAGATAATKADAWQALASYENVGDMRPGAEEQARKYRQLAEAQAKRKAELEILKNKYTNDKERLTKLLAYDDDVVSKVQKAAYQKEFDEAYGPLNAELIEAGALSSGSSSSPSSTSSYVPSDSSSSSSGDSDDSGPGIFDSDPSVEDELFEVRGDFGYHSQTFEISPDGESCGGFLSDDRAVSCRDFSLSGPYTGGSLAINFGGDGDSNAGILAFGRYYLGATGPALTTNAGGGEAGLVTGDGTTPADEATGAFSIGGGARFVGQLGDRTSLRFSGNVGYVQFLEGATQRCLVAGSDPVTYEDVEDASPSGINIDMMLGLDLYILSFFSLGGSAALGWGTVSAKGCAGDTTIGEVPTVQDLGGDSWSATLGGHAAFHF